MDKKNADSISATSYHKRTSASVKAPAEDSDVRSNRSGRSGASGGSQRQSAGKERARSPGRSSRKGKPSQSESAEMKYHRTNGKLTPELSKKCYGVGFKITPKPCTKSSFNWQEGKYLRDECGSGMVPFTRNFKTGRSVWCRTPLSMYQATHGELGRQVLCREKKIVRDIRPAPPCNMCHSILPLCKGYYRKYECVRPCEEEFATRDSHGQKDYRDVLHRYWDPCSNEAEHGALDINLFAHHNVALGMRMKRKLEDQPCW